MRLASVALLAGALQACSTISNVGQDIRRSMVSLLTPDITLMQIRVVAEVNANQNSATELDIVFVHEKTSLALLPKTGPEWFAQKAALMAALATSLDVVSLQVPPGTVVDVPMKPSYTKAVGVIGFANYLSPDGQAAGNLSQYKKMMIWLTPTNVLYKGN